MDEFEVKQELELKRTKIKSFEELCDFLKYIEENCNTGYGVAPRAIAQAALGVAWYLALKFGITGFQSGFVMWDFILGWEYVFNKTGLKIIDFDNMLYPQYSEYFEKTIPDSIWLKLQKEASTYLGYTENVSDAVVEHWKSIADGKIPFGYKVQGE